MQKFLSESERHRLDTLRASGFCDSALPVLDDFVRLAAITWDTPIAVIGVVEEQSVWFKTKIGLPFEEIAREQAFCAFTIQQSDVVIVPDPLADMRFAASSLVTEAAIRFYAGAAFGPDNYPFGALAVMDRVPHFPTEEQKAALRILARRIGSQVRDQFARSDAGDAITQKHADEFKPPDPVRSLGRILLLEDDNSLRALLERTLAKAGFTVVSAAGGAQALLYAQGEQIDLLVSDVVLPKENGVQLAHQIASICPGVKTLFISSFIDQLPQFRDLIKIGNVLEKPFLPKDLVQEVKRILNEEQTSATGTNG